VNEIARALAECAVNLGRVQGGKVDKGGWQFRLLYFHENMPADGMQYEVSGKRVSGDLTPFIEEPAVSAEAPGCLVVAWPGFTALDAVKRAERSFQGFLDLSALLPD
jgi:hypothetical protein